MERFLTDNDKERKIAAIKSIGQSGDIRFTGNIIKGLYDSEWEVRAVAAKILGRLGEVSVIDHLSKSLTDSEWWVRYNSAVSIIGLPSGINVIRKVLDGDDIFARDILIATIENSNFIKETGLYENSTDPEKRRLLQIIKSHTESKA